MLFSEVSYLPVLYTRVYRNLEFELVVLDISCLHKLYEQHILYCSNRLAQKQYALYLFHIKCHLID